MSDQRAVPTDATLKKSERKIFLVFREVKVEVGRRGRLIGPWPGLWALDDILTRRLNENLTTQNP